MALSRPVTIALDGFGAEQGFDVLAEGARRAAADGIGVRVFGPQGSLGLDGVEGIEVVPTTEWIGNDDDPVHSVRERKDASVVRAVVLNRLSTSHASRAPDRSIAVAVMTCAWYA